MRHEAVVQPQQCVLAVGIPSSRGAFLRHLEERERHHFVPAVCPAWPAYHRIVRNLETGLTAVRALGVCVRQDLTLAEFHRCFADATVVILFSHWAAGRVEFDDGLASIDDVVAAVPRDYSGVVDLCVCHPAELVLQLRRCRQKCLVKASRSAARVSYWLQFYIVLFTLLRSRRLVYNDAVEAVARRFLTHSPKDDRQ